MGEEKPMWDETWNNVGVGIETGSPAHTPVAEFCCQLPEHRPGDCRLCEGRARLGSMAPEMARMLVSLVTYGSDSNWECPDCEADLFPRGAGEPDVESQVAVHKADCALVAVLRRAGVLPEVTP